jgi:FkbM family methyltransferase
LTEEPDTIEWLDTLEPGDVLWDVGANVGLYSIYAAKYRNCRVVAFEPESQNYALLMDNIALNEVRDKLDAVCMAVAETEGFGHLVVPLLTKGGAYNLFEAAQNVATELPESIRAGWQFGSRQKLRQLTFACSIDELTAHYGFPVPSHIKIDVDGIEHKIIEGARRTLESASVRSLLVELNEKSRQDQEVPRVLEKYGFQLTKRRSVWDSKPNKCLEGDMPAYNAIFTRVASPPSCSRSAPQ